MKEASRARLMRSNASFSDSLTRNEPRQQSERDKSMKVQRAATMPNLFAKQSNSEGKNWHANGSFSQSRTAILERNSGTPRSETKNEVLQTSSQGSLKQQFNPSKDDKLGDVLKSPRIITGKPSDPFVFKQNHRWCRSYVLSLRKWNYNRFLETTQMLGFKGR
jgi:hypothetical protein